MILLCPVGRANNDAGSMIVDVVTPSVRGPWKMERARNS